MSTVITIQNLGKKYSISHQQREDHTALRDVITNCIASLGKILIHPFRRDLAPCPLPITTASEDFWALKDVSFEVKQGDRIGIIGRNGAGKSTLLKILSRITEPTTGSIRIKGRVASLLEVGTGFHPELTGRENIFLNGAILGMQREEIRRKFDEIVDFSEIEKFLDTPVKRYSSGMYVRLAFAVAAHLEPEILIVDEVLAVGDAQFQKKCLGKMEDVGREGRTVLFVTHNTEAILNLCSKALLLRSGELVNAGGVREVVNHYLKQYAQLTTHQEWKEIKTAPGNDKAKLLKVLVKPSDGPSRIFYSDVSFEFEFVFFNMLTGEHNLDVTYHLVDERGILVYVGSTVFCNNKKFKSGLIKAKCIVPGNLLNEGTYTVNRLLLVRDRGNVVYEHKDVLTFEIIHPATGHLGWVGEKEGVIRPNLNWELYTTE